MPIYLYWGEDDFAIVQAATALHRRLLDPVWSSFNYDKITVDHPDGIKQGLNQAMTPPFGAANRFVWLAETSLCQRCPEALLTELERTLPELPESTTLLLTTTSKPDSRLKSTKLLQKHATIQEFALIPTWKADLLIKQVKQTAQELGVKLTAHGAELLADLVGNDTRQLHSELEKLRLYGGDGKPLDEAAIANLVTASSQSTIQLAAAIRQGQTAQALDLIADLLRQNEPALRIVSSLVTQFRTWVWIKLMRDAGERREQEIAKAAELRNPKRLYFLQKEVESLSSQTLLQTLPLLLELEASLKRGADELLTFQTTIIQLCELCR
jgi:DNA polymerase III subunit delta